MYLPRTVDSEIEELARSLPALVLQGAKGVGKTATAEQTAKSVIRLDNPVQRSIIEADLDRLTTGLPPILIDEWQRLGASWDVVRRAVDDDAKPGRFLLTGSAASTDHSTHSGAGRIATVHMRPLSLSERRIATQTVSLDALLSGCRDDVGGTTSVRLEQYVQEILHSGFPGLRALDGRALRTQLDSYINRIVDHDFEELGRRVRNPSILRRWMSAYASASSMTASYETLRDAATSGEGEKPAKTTTQPYRDILEQLWIIDDIPAWLPSRNHVARLASPSKRQLVDPALAARLLGVTADSLLGGQGRDKRFGDGALLGQLFESLVTQSIRVYAQACEAQTKHLRTRGGEHEVDLIIERDDRRVLAIEVKLASTIKDDDVHQLSWLHKELGDALIDSVIINTGPEAYRRKDGIAVVPAALLSP